MLTKFADATDILGVADNGVFKSLIEQSELVGKLDASKYMPFHMVICIFIYLTKKEYGPYAQKGDLITGNRDSENGLGFMVNNNLNRSSHYDAVAKRANANLGCTSREIQS